MNHSIIDLILDMGLLAHDITDAAHPEYEEEIEDKTPEELEEMILTRENAPWRCKHCFRENEAQDEICLGCKKNRYLF